MTTTANADNLRQQKRTFSLIVEQILSLRALTWLEKLRICLQILSDLHNDVLRYR